VGIGTDIEYAYKVTNIGGSTINNINVTDDKLGFIGNIPFLDPAQMETLTENAFIAVTTTNIASVTGDGPGGQNCPDSNPVTVTVIDPPDPGVKCDGKLRQLTLIWDGEDNTEIAPQGNDLMHDHPDSFVDKGDEVTFSYGGSEMDGDIFVDVDRPSEPAGYSRFHVTCSDHDLDGDSTTNYDSDQVSPAGRDCYKPQGDGKGNGKSGADPNGINEWLLEGFEDKNHDVLDCSSI
jgi:hypothetical protein